MASEIAGLGLLAVQNTGLNLMVTGHIHHTHPVLCGLLVRRVLCLIRHRVLRLFHQNNWGAGIGFAAAVGIEGVDNIVEGGLGSGGEALDIKKGFEVSQKVKEPLKGGGDLQQQNNGTGICFQIWGAK